MNSEARIRLFNKDITQEDIGLIKELIRSEGHKGRTYLSKELCNHWQWRTNMGRLRDIACWQLLLKLEKKGCIKLPAPLQKTKTAGIDMSSI